MRGQRPEKVRKEHDRNEESDEDMAQKEERQQWGTQMGQKE